MLTLLKASPENIRTAAFIITKGFSRFNIIKYQVKPIYYLDIVWWPVVFYGKHCQWMNEIDTVKCTLVQATNNECLNWVEIMNEWSEWIYITYVLPVILKSNLTWVLKCIPVVHEKVHHSQAHIPLIYKNMNKDECYLFQTSLFGCLLILSHL